jgi:hypothetical protein
MEDAMLNALRHEPSPEFAEQLRARLRSQDAAVPPLAHRSPLRTVAASAAAVILLGGVLSVPAVRASAASFLALFRVSNFVAVEVDSSRLDTLKAQQLDIKSLVGENVQVVQDPGPAMAVVSIEQAAAAAGYDVKVPGWLPRDARIIEISVSGEGVARITANATRLEQVMDALGITDLRVPDGLNGQIMTVRVPRGVIVRYEHGPRRTRFFQAPSPEVTMPQGVELAALGEIGLRILGLSAADAREFSRVIDWNSTLIVPLPSGVRSMKRVEISGNPGIAVEYTDSARTNMVLWSGGGRVFGIVSLQEMSQVLEMANSVP